MAMTRIRREVKVHALWDELGNIEPCKVFLDNTTFSIDHLLSVEKAASILTGGFGLCFCARITCADDNRSGVSNLYFERMPGQQDGVVLDEENDSTPSQLWHYFDSNGDRQNVKVLAEWSSTGAVRPLIMWIGHHAFHVKTGMCERCASRKDGGEGIRYVCTITNREQFVNRKPFVLYFDKCQQPEVWFVEAKERVSQP